MNAAEVRHITLPKGGTLEVAMTPEFVSVVRKHFNLGAYDIVEDDHVRMFIWGSVKNAVDKVDG